MKKKVSLKEFYEIMSNVGGFEMNPLCETYENLAKETDVAFFKAWEKKNNVG